MTKKITISIPDVLHERLKEYRERFSISAICAEALRKRMDEFDEHISRAKNRFHIHSFEEAKEIAYKRGLDWASNEASIEEIAFVSECELYTGGASEFYWLAVDEEKGNPKMRELEKNETGMGGYIEDMKFVKDLENQFLEEDEHGIHLEQHIELLENFYKGVKLVWDSLKDRKYYLLNISPY